MAEQLFQPACEDAIQDRNCHQDRTPIRLAAQDCKRFFNSLRVEAIDDG